MENSVFCQSAGFDIAVKQNDVYALERQLPGCKKAGWSCSDYNDLMPFWKISFHGSLLLFALVCLRQIFAQVLPAIPLSNPYE